MIEKDNEDIIIDGVKANFPKNSHKIQNEQPEPKRQIQKVVTGKVIKQKKSLAKTIKEGVFGDETRSVGDYILHDVVIPAFKSLLYDTFAGGLEMRLFGEKRRTNINRDRGRSHVNYSSYYGKEDRRPYQDYRQKDISQVNRARHNFDDIILESRADAEEVLSNLADACHNYGQATVADFYELVGVTSEYTDRKYGWADINQATVTRVRDGYLINLPRPQVLD